MLQPHAAATLVERHIDRLLELRVALDGLSQAHPSAIDLDAHGAIVRIIGARSALRRVPQAMAPIDVPGLAERRGIGLHCGRYFTQHVAPTVTGVAHDARPVGGRQHQFDVGVRQPNVVSRPGTKTPFSRSRSSRLTMASRPIDFNASLLAANAVVVEGHVV